MSTDNLKIFDGQNYSTYFLIIGIIGSLISFVAIVVMSTFLLMKIREEVKILRKKRAHPKELKQKYLSVVFEIENLFKEGKIGENGVFYEISRAMRNYSSEKTGRMINSLTKEDIKGDKELKYLFNSIEKIYFPEFSKRIQRPQNMSANEAIEIATKLIEEW